MSAIIRFDQPQAVYFIGIGGISMSGLAEVLLTRGFTVAGSDIKPSPLTDHLSGLGATIFIGQREENVKENSGIVVFTAAIHPDNPEYKKAQTLGLPMMTRAELLGQLMKNYENALAISGTHGKTTTTSMISEIFLAAKKDPTISVGGILPSIGGNIRIGASGTFITEACEYTNSFLSFFPTLGVILNVAEDHLDFFEDLADIRRSFAKFAGLLPESGRLVINGDMENIAEFTDAAPCPAITFGRTGEDLDYRVVLKNIPGENSFEILKKGEPYLTLTLRVPGIHNCLNAAAAVAVADCYGIDADTIKAALESFSGAERRFERKGEHHGFLIVDDYAHHPDEIRATLSAARMTGQRKIWCVFQPHTYTRTKALLPEFADALGLADHTILAKIYPAREQDIYGVSSADVVRLMNEAGKEAIYLDTFAAIEDYLETHAAPGDLVITMGAGDIVKLGEEMLSHGE